MKIKNTATENENPVLGSQLDIKLLINILWSEKFIIISITSLFAVFSIVLALSLPNKYTSSTLLRLSQDQADNTLSSISSNFSGLASIAGVNLPSNADESEYAIQTLTSREFIRHIASFDGVKINLIAAKGYDSKTKKVIIDNEIYDEMLNKWVRSPTKYTQSDPTYLEIHKKYNKSIKVSKDKLSGFISISFEHYSPVFAKELLDLVIKELNNISRERKLKESKEALNYLETVLKKENQTDVRDTINKLIASQLQTQMFSYIKEDYLLETIDEPFIPEMKSAPSRAILCIAITVIGTMLASFFALIKYNYSRSSYKNV